MSPKNLFHHGTPKSEILATLHTRIRRLQLGHVFVDSTRISDAAANLSAEPDIVVVSQASIDEGRVRFAPAASGRTDSYIEIEGPPDLVVEVVSDSSVGKDTQRLPQAYFAAGVIEYWLVDARGVDLVFQIQTRGRDGFRGVTQDEDGFQFSDVLRCPYRLTRQRGLGGFWQYELQAASPAE